jgi:hypothetical protein
LQLSQLDILSNNQEPVAFFHTNLDVDLSNCFVNAMKHAEAVMRPKADFPCRLKWSRLPQRQYTSRKEISSRVRIMACQLPALPWHLLAEPATG